MKSTIILSKNLLKDGANMNFKYILAITFLLISSTSSAGGPPGGMRCQLGVSPPGQQYSPAYDQPPTQYALNELNTIYGALCPPPNGCGTYFLTLNNTAPNALAMAVGPGQTKIAYNPNFMGQVFAQFGPGASFGILAHEFGHHIDFHTTPPWMNNAWSRELKADSWAGCALAKVGLGPNQIQNALYAIAAYPSPTHPGWPQRIQAVQTGFTSCGGQWSNNFN